MQESSAMCVQEIEVAAVHYGSAVCPMSFYCPMFSPKRISTGIFQNMTLVPRSLHPKPYDVSSAWVIEAGSRIISDKWQRASAPRFCSHNLALVEVHICYMLSHHVDFSEFVLMDDACKSLISNQRLESFSSNSHRMSQMQHGRSMAWLPALEAIENASKCHKKVHEIPNPNPYT